MRLPRDLSGEALISLLHRYGYELTRQTGAHIRLTSTNRGSQHHVTIPRHKALRVGTLNDILADVAGYLEIDRQALLEELLGR